MKPEKDIKYEPYWWLHAKPHLKEHRDWQSNADVVIIGSGYTGLSAALTLLEKKLKVVLIDSQLPGYGASSRNGGITSGSIKPSFKVLKKRFGLEQAKKIVQEGNTARNDLYNFIRNENVECDLQQNGMFIGATSIKSFDNQQRESEELHKAIGSETVLVDKKNVQNFIDSPKYVGGSFDKKIGSIHPAKLVSSMVNLVLKKNGYLFSNTKFLNAEKQNGLFHVKTDGGTLIAKHLIMATNAYTDKSIPWLRKRLVPVISEMIATESIGENRVKSLMPKLSTFAEALNVFYYFRPSPDGTRILIGGRRVSYGKENHSQKLVNGLLGIFPDLKNSTVSNHWHGFVTFPFDLLPKLVMHDGIIYAAGYCGSGTVWARWMGKKAAEIILNLESKSAFYNIPFKKVPFYNGTPWFLPIAIEYYKLKDWWINSNESNI